jgi:hypothetical protein
MQKCAIKKYLQKLPYSVPVLYCTRYTRIGTDQKTFIYLFKRPATLNPALEIFVLFSIFVGFFALLDPNPDPASQINADLCGSGSETMNKTY